MPLTPEQQEWVNNGAIIGPDGVPYIEPGGYYIINGTGHVNQSGYPLPLFGPPPSGVQWSMVPDPIEDVIRANNGGSLPPTVSQYFNSPDPGVRFNPAPAPAPAPAPPSSPPATGPFPPSSQWLNMLWTMMPPRPQPPRPISTIFDPRSFAPSVNPFPGGLPSLPSQNFDLAGESVKSGQGVNEITSKAMESNERLAHTAGTLYHGAPVTGPVPYDGIARPQVPGLDGLPDRGGTAIGWPGGPTNWYLPPWENSTRGPRTGK